MPTSRSGYGQYCPTARALDVLGERWTLLIIRNLIAGSTRFNQLARGLPRLSRALLTTRLRQLERAGLVERLGSQYLLTDAGRSLEPMMANLAEWGAEWAFGPPAADELDATLLVFWMHNRMDTSRLPGSRHVFHILFTNDPQRFWIVIEYGEPSVCLIDPGFDVDVTITADVGSLYEVWLGHLPLKQAIRAGRLEFSGAPALIRRMPAILQLSPVAPVVAAHRSPRRPSG
jgi:DNA-binding HxlR family transcriptional regulator